MMSLFFHLMLRFFYWWCCCRTLTLLVMILFGLLALEEEEEAKEVENASSLAPSAAVWLGTKSEETEGAGEERTVISRLTGPTLWSNSNLDN